MVTTSVAVSGTVGKQSFTATQPVVLKGFLLHRVAANATVVIRDGLSGGTIQYEHSALSAQNPTPVLLSKEGHRFDKGMHVKVLGTGAICYLFIE